MREMMQLASWSRNPCGGAIVKEDVRPAGGGRPARYYRLGDIG
jgi:hypothetical protein